MATRILGAVVPSLHTPGHHHPTPANIWDRPVCTKLLGWAGRGPGSRCIPATGTGSDGERDQGLDTSVLGLSRERQEGQLRDEGMLEDGFLRGM